MADTYSNRTLTAFFDSREDAEDAVSRLRQLGIAEPSLRMVGGGESTYADREKGFWETLGDLFFPEEDRATYAEGLRRGGYLVTVSDIEPGRYDQVLDILDDEGSVDLDQRAEAWRSEGWTGYDAGASGSYAGVAATGDRSGATAADVAPRRGEEEVIPVVREELRVGKRDVNLGRVRVRSYVVEEPVSEEVNLREERVRVERRPVDRPVEAGDRLFTDKVIEAEEHAEEAVIAKEARVTEEIALRREQEERSKTVSDTVRHTEVEVEDERSGTDRTRNVQR